MRYVLSTVLMILLLAATASAQGITWRLQVYPVGSDPVMGTPFYTLSLPGAIVRCAKTQTLPTVPSTTPVNPYTLWWTQPELPGYVCKADLSRQTSFKVLPVGGPYPFALVASNTSGDADPTPGLDPFLKRAVPTAVGVLMIR